MKTMYVYDVKATDPVLPGKAKEPIDVPFKVIDCREAEIKTLNVNRSPLQKAKDRKAAKEEELFENLAFVLYGAMCFAFGVFTTIGITLIF